MSKVKIQGNASGTGIFTVAAPATNTDRTITLPDSVGTIVTTGDTSSVSAGMLASSLDLSSKTLTLPSTLTTPLVPLQTVQLSGLTSFNFSVAAYPMYQVFFTNLGGSVANAHVYMGASYDNGSSYVSNWNYRTRAYFVDNTTADNNTNTGNSGTPWLWNWIWNGAAPSGTHGYVLIAGTSYYSANKRLTYSGVFGGQTQSGQCMQLQMGQTQDDSHTYNRVMIGLTSGTFYGNSTALICGVKAQ